MQQLFLKDERCKHPQVNGCMVECVDCFHDAECPVCKNEIDPNEDNGYFECDVCGHKGCVYEKGWNKICQN
jgi:hypothetical protein